MHWVYYFGRIIIHFLIFPVASWKTTGRENVPDRGPLLIICNHLHLADPPIVAASIKLRAVFMAKEELFRHWWTRFWVQNFGSFPIRRNGVDRQAFRTAEDWLQQGVSLVMFPEGKRSSNGQLQPALPGAALIASRLGVPILPMSITGTEKLKDLWWSFMHRPRITVTIGRPFNPPSIDGKMTREHLKQLTDTMMREIARLMPPQYHGVYTGGENAQDRESG